MNFLVITSGMKIMFGIGFIIFAVYIYALLRAIHWGHSSQRKDLLNDPELRNYYGRHGSPDYMDYDGMGNYGRFPKNPYDKKLKRNVKRKEKTSNSYRSSR